LFLGVFRVYDHRHAWETTMNASKLFALAILAIIPFAAPPLPPMFPTTSSAAHRLRYAQGQSQRRYLNILAA